MKKTNRSTTALLIVIFLAGLSLLLYPSVANYWNSLHQTREITSYVEAVSAMDSDVYDRQFQQAVSYNVDMLKRGNAYLLEGEEQRRYTEMLDVTGTGVMGYIDIPAIAVTLPIYHGTSDSVLQIGIGHLEWTSLPVGGVSSHCVLSGHRGLPSSMLFTNLDKVVIGDVFTLRVLNEILTYEVDQILIVEPKETQSLEIVRGEDYCTLVTCTPYGINTHRMLVRGRRIENAEEAVKVSVTAEAIQIEPAVVAFLMGIPALLLMVFLVLLGGDKKERRMKREGGQTENERKTE